MTHSNNQTSNQYGLPLEADSMQSILPVVNKDTGMVYGFFTITPTLFDGTETEIDIGDMEADGYTLAIESVTLHPGIDDGSGYGVRQYMAVTYTSVEARISPWAGRPEFRDTNNIGYARSFSMPTQGQVTHFTRGPLVSALKVGMSVNTTVPSPEDPEASDGAMSWVANLGSNSAQLKFGFFDFLWTAMFATQSTREPLSLEIVSNPVEGHFKSTLVPTPVVTPLGGVQFNTVRIIVLSPPPPGDYEFEYNVLDTSGGSTAVTLTLTVI